MITTVKLSADIENPDTVTGYIVNGDLYVPIDPANIDYMQVQEWVSEGHIPAPAFTQGELDAYEKEKKIIAIRQEMEELIGTMTTSEAMFLMLQYGMQKMNPSQGDQNDDPTPTIPLTPTGEDLIVWGDRIASGLEQKIIELRSL